MKDVERDLNEIVAISFWKRGNGTNQSSLRRAQFVTCLRESPHSEGKAKMASTNFRKGSKCAENSKIIDSTDDCLAFWGKLQMLANQFKRSLHFTARIQMQYLVASWKRFANCGFSTRDSKVRQRSRNFEIEQQQLIDLPLPVFLSRLDQCFAG